MLAGVALSACAPASEPDGEVMRPAHRFVDAGVDEAGLLTHGLPVATIRDDRRYVLRSPLRTVLLWPKILEDRTGNRTVTVESPVPEALRDVPALLVLSRVQVGSRWFELPPRPLPIQAGGNPPSVELEFPIPENPSRRKLVISADAYAIGRPDLGRVETRPVEIPAGARLNFALGLVEPDWGWDPVEFSMQACEGERCQRLFSERVDPRADAAPWRERSLALGHLAGRVRHLVFEARRLSEEATFSFPVWANPTLYAPTPRTKDQPNVILLSIDTLRADHLTSYGYRHDTAPFAEERFAKGGTVFETAVVASTMTTPSHASIFTSLYPAAHGAIDGSKRLPVNIATLAERVRGADVDTAAITEDGWLGVAHGFGRGFDVFLENKSPDIMSPEGQVDATFSEARRWLASRRDKRFFLFIHTFQVHSPYAPPERYAHLFSEHEAGRIDEASPPHLQSVAGYDREIRYTDDELRLLLDEIDALGLGRNTVFILTSDHGEAFLEHGVLEHGCRLDDEVVRVPLMFWGRGIPAGRRIGVPVTNLDLMPTILELLRIPVPEGLQGRSLLGLIEGRDEASDFAQRPLFSEAWAPFALGPGRQLKAFFPPAYLVRVGNWKLARYRTRLGDEVYEYYDVADDPLERENLYPTRSEEAHDLAALVDGYEETSRRHRERIDRGAAPDPEPVLLDPRREEKLRALGYLE